MMQNLSWNQRFAIIDHFELNDQQACAAFGITEPELSMAQKLRESANLWEPDTSLDFSRYEELIKVVKPEALKPSKSATQKPKNDTTEKANEATPRRGRKTHKIKDAYEAVPFEPVPVDEFRKQYDVSLSVLRRHKDFDHLKEKGQVNVRKTYLNRNDEEKVLCIWRERP